MPRIEINDSPRVLVTKAGFSTDDPGLTEDGKIFDSEWLFGGSLIMAGVYEDTAPASHPGQDYTPYYYSKMLVRTWVSSPITINYPEPLDFIPSITIMPLADPYYWHSNSNPQMGLSLVPSALGGRVNTASVTETGFTIQREPHATSSAYWKFSFIYLVLSL